MRTRPPASTSRRRRFWAKCCEGRTDRRWDYYGRAVSVPGQRHLREVRLYSITDAARFTGARPVDVRRWVEGYAYRDSFQPAVSEHAARLASGSLYLTFHHMIEVWAINRMRRPVEGGKGIPLQWIRRAAASAREIY